MDSQQPVTSVPGHVMLSYIIYGLLYICSMHKFTHHHTLHSYTHRHAHAHIHKKSNTFTTLHSYKQTLEYHFTSVVRSGSEVDIVKIDLMSVI